MVTSVVLSSTITPFTYERSINDVSLLVTTDVRRYGLSRSWEGLPLGPLSKSKKKMGNEAKYSGNDWPPPWVSSGGSASGMTVSGSDSDRGHEKN